MKLAEEKYFEFGEFRLEPEDGVLLRDGERITLPPKVFELLLLFVESGGRVVGREEMMNRLWPDTSVDAANLKQIIYTLRKTLGDSSDENPMIKTLPKRGYRFVPAVRLIGSGPLSAESDELVYTNVSIEKEVFEIDEDDGNVIDVAPRRALDPNAAAFLSPAVARNESAYRTTTLIVLAISCLLAGGLIYYLASSNGKAPLSSENLTLQKLTNTDNLYWAILSPNGQFVAYILLHRDGRQSLHLLDIATRSERMLVEPDSVSFYGGGFSPDSSKLYYDIWRHDDATGNCILYQVPVLGDVPRKIVEGVAGPVSFSPDGKRVVFTRANRVNGETLLLSANASDGSEQKVISSTPNEYDFIAPGWSPDGSHILFVASEKREDGLYWYVAELPAEGGDRRKITEPLKQRFWEAAWLGDGSTILLNAAAPDTKIGQLFTIDHQTGTISRLTNDLNYYSGLSASADGKKIVVTQGQRYDDVWVGAADGTTPPQKITNRSVTIDSLEWTGDGRILYNESENGKHTLWAITDNGQSRTRVTASEIEAFYPDVSPDGTHIVCRSNRSGTWQIWYMKSDGTEMRQITPDSETTGRAQFAYGGSRIIYERRVNDADVLSIRDLNGGEPVDISPSLIGQWAVAPDGMSVAYSFFDTEKKRSRTAIQSLDNPDSIRYLEIIPRDFIIFSPDARSILTKRHEPEDDPISSIWQFPIDGAEPKRVFANPPYNIYSAAFSHDGTKFGVVQGRTVTNLVLFTRAD